jgi:hypothetical protein
MADHLCSFGGSGLSHHVGRLGNAEAGVGVAFQGGGAEVRVLVGGV